MRTQQILGCGILLAVQLTSCNGPQKQGSSATTTTTDEFANGPVCYLSLAGNHSEDSTRLMLARVEGNIRGTLAYYPFEKDKREGVLLDCKENNDIISANWVFRQEGMNDTIPVSFKLNGKNILQQPNVLDASSGKEQLDKSAGHTIEYQLVDCPK